MSRPVREKSELRLVKGLIAGAIAGIVATAAKSLAESIYPPRVHGEPEPPELLAEAVAGHPLDHETKEIAGETIHWSFGVLTGAAYGALAEFYPAATAKDGAAFGMTLMSLTHETALPAMGLGAPSDEQTAREHTSETATHVVYGVVTETVRKFVRSMLG